VHRARALRCASCRHQRCLPQQPSRHLKLLMQQQERRTSFKEKCRLSWQCTSLRAGLQVDAAGDTWHVIENRCVSCVWRDLHLDISICKWSPSPQDRPMSSPHHQDNASQRWMSLKPVPQQSCSMFSSCVDTSDRGSSPLQASSSLPASKSFTDCALTFRAALAAFLSVSSSDRLLATFLLA